MSLKKLFYVLKLTSLDKNCPVTYDKSKRGKIKQEQIFLSIQLAVACVTFKWDNAPGQLRLNNCNTKQLTNRTERRSGPRVCY